MEQELEKQNGKPNANESNKGNNKKGSKGNRGKGNKKYVHGNGKKEGKETPPRNDWQFYAASEQIAKDVASIPFNYLGGTNFKLGVKELSGTTVNDRVLESILSIGYVNSIGVSSNKTNGINMAAVQLYSYIRHANSGARNYEAPDVMMYVLAMRDLYSAYFEAKRILGLVGQYQYYNHNYPDLIIHSANIDAKDLRANQAQYRGRLNIIARKINSFAVPKYFKVFERSAYMSSFIFTDSSSVRGQAYQFIRRGWYKWDPTAYDTGTALTYTDYDFSKINKYSYLLDVLEEMLDALYLDEDALTMSGDILKAFSEGELFTVSECNDGYCTSFVLDEDILSQIENSVYPIPGTVNTYKYEGFDITQESQTIRFNPSILLQNYTSNSDILSFESRAFNSHKDNPDFKDVLEWSRLLATWEDEDLGMQQARRTFTSTGLELIVSLYSFRYDHNAPSDPDRIVAQPLHTEWSGIGSTTDSLNDSLSVLGQYNWHPIIYVLSQNSATTLSEIAIVADLKVATPIASSTVKNINDAAVYSAFYGTMYNSKK